MKLIHYIKIFIHDFIFCGTTGLFLEVIFTGLHSLQRRDMSMRATTSLVMFPIYGCGALIYPFYRLLRRCNVFIRGLCYMSGIFLAEFISGTYLTKKKRCPWCYERSRYNVRSVIRLDYAPYWFLTGLLFESQLKKRSHSVKG